MKTGFFDAAKIDSDSKEKIGITETKTPEQVVETAMRPLRSGKRVAISGRKNSVMARMGHFMPNGFITKTLAKSFRKNFL